MCIIYLIAFFTVRGVSVANATQILAAAMLLLLIYEFRKCGFVLPLNGITLMQSFVILIGGSKFEIVSLTKCSPKLIYSQVL
jgi:hypothetical protein